MSTLNVDKVDPSSGTALELGTSGDTITVPSGATFVVAGTTEITGTNNVQRPNVNPLIINGDMAVAQRSTSVASITASGYHTLDRWQTNSSTAAGAWTQSQDTDVPTGEGFASSIKMDCTTADASLAAGDRLIIQQAFEGQNLQLLKKGTADAEILTLSFWIKSVLTGTYIVELYDSDNTRQISKSYTVDSGSTWEKKLVTFAGDTTGALGNDNAASLYVNLWLAAGTTYTSGTLNTSWAANTNANRAVGQANLASSTSNNCWITGVQLEVGEFTASTIPPFQHESYGNNLARCQRYFQMFGGSFYGAYSIMYVGSVYTTSSAYIPHPMPTIMRSKPSFVMGGALSNFTWQDGNTTQNPTGIAAEQMHENMFLLLISDSGDDFTDGQAIRCYNNSTAGYFEISAEL